jgi:hypothetical protein
MELYNAHTQWASRPKDERFQTLHDLHKSVASRRASSIDTRYRIVDAHASAQDGEFLIHIQGQPMRFTHWTLTQLFTKLSIPKDFLTLVSSDLGRQIIGERLVAAVREGKLDNYQRMLVQTTGTMPTIRAFHSRRYERLWDMDVTKMLMEYLPPDWRNPVAFKDGIWGNDLVPSGLYAGDRDMFAFFVDGGDWKDLPPGTFDVDGEAFHNGFFVWNSEVGAKTHGYSTFKFKVTCGNNIVWGARDLQVHKAKHIGSANTVLRHLRDYLTTLNTQDNDAFIEAVRTAKRETFVTVKGKDTKATLDEAYTKSKKKFTQDELESSLTLGIIEAQKENRPIDGSKWFWLQGLTAAARYKSNADDKIGMEARAAEVMLSV